MKQIENTLQDLKCMLIEDGYTESNIVMRTLVKAQEQVKNNQILQDLLNEQEEIVMSPIRFNGVHINKIKQVFAKYEVEIEQQF